MWGVYSMVKTNQKNDGANKNRLGSSGNKPLINPLYT